MLSEYKFVAASLLKECRDLKAGGRSAHLELEDRAQPAIDFAKQERGNPRECERPNTPGSLDEN